MSGYRRVVRALRLRSEGKPFPGSLLVAHAEQQRILEAPKFDPAFATICAMWPQDMGTLACMVTHPLDD